MPAAPRKKTKGSDTRHCTIAGNAPMQRRDNLSFHFRYLSVFCQGSLTYCRQSSFQIMGLVATLNKTGGNLAKVPQPVDIP
jgi:hypothetical protein